jgi:hypothetical protein
MQFSSLFGNKHFNETIDTPFLTKAFLNGGSYSDLNLLAIPLQSQNQLKGLLRLFSVAKVQEKDYELYERAGQSIG